MFTLRFFDIISHSLRRDAPNTPSKITFTPKLLAPKKIPKKFKVIFPHHPRRETLQKLHNLARRIILTICHKKMNVLWSKFQANQLDIKFTQFLPKINLGQFQNFLIRENLSSISNCQLDVIVKFSDSVRVATCFKFHFNPPISLFSFRKLQLHLILQRSRDNSLLSLVLSRISSYRRQSLPTRSTIHPPTKLGRFLDAANF